MSFLVVHADRAATLLADDPIVPAAKIPQLKDAIALLARAGEIRDAEDSAHADAAEAARREGHAAGLAEGRAAAAEEVAAELLRIARDDHARAAERRADVVRLALAVVRRIAADLDGEMVAALAQRAVAAQAHDAAVTVRVAPAALEATRARLAGRTGILVEADASLDAQDCVVATALGRVIAGLEPQLARIEAAWQADG
jgi:flagellar biosynthesis/type III secretory pathway protein FliH